MKEVCGNCEHFEQAGRTPRSGECKIKRETTRTGYTVFKDNLCDIDSFSPSRKVVELERLDREEKAHALARKNLIAAIILAISTIILATITGGYLFQTRRMATIMERDFQLRSYPSLYLVDDPKNIKEGENIKTKIILANGGPGARRVKPMIVWVLDGVPHVDQSGFFVDRGIVVKVHDLSFNMPPGKREIFRLHYPIRGKVKQLELAMIVRFVIPLKEQYEYEIFTYQLKKADSPLSGWDPTSDTRKSELTALFKKNDEIRRFLEGRIEIN